MKNASSPHASLKCIALALAGCSTSPTNAQIGTGVGAVAGGVVGDALFGGDTGAAVFVCEGITFTSVEVGVCTVLLYP